MAIDPITRKELLLSGRYVEPITRREMFLAKIMGFAVATPEPITRGEKLLAGHPLEPITRREMFLAKLSGMAVTLPEPITREEMFLKNAVSGGGGGGEEPVYHTVKFYNGDVLLDSVQVLHGMSASYTGDEPVKDGDYKFNGWNPSPTNVTADMDCYAQFRSTVLYYAKLLDRTIASYNSNSLKSVGYRAFFECRNMHHVDFPSVKSVADNAFYSSTLTTADFGEVTNIYGAAFRGSNLKTLILRGKSVCVLESTNAFRSTPIYKQTGYIYVPSALVDSYKSGTNWSTYATQIRAIEDYPEICGGDA